MKFCDAALAWAIALAPAAGLAQPVTGPYISLGGGIDYLQNQAVHGSAEPYTGNRLGVNVGPIGSASIGYGLGNGLRIELQGDFSSEKFTQGVNGYFQQYHGFAVCWCRRRLQPEPSRERQRVGHRSDGQPVLSSQHGHGRKLRDPGDRRAGVQHQRCPWPGTDSRIPLHRLAQ